MYHVYPEHGVCSCLSRIIVYFYIHRGVCGSATVHARIILNPTPSYSHTAPERYRRMPSTVRYDVAPTPVPAGRAYDTPRHVTTQGDYTLLCFEHSKSPAGAGTAPRRAAARNVALERAARFSPFARAVDGPLRRWALTLFANTSP